MGASNYNYYNSSRVLHLSILQVIFFFSVFLLALPEATARGEHGGGSHLGSGSYQGGQGRHFSGGSHFGGGQRHSDGGRRHFGNPGKMGGDKHKHIGGAHRSYFGGSFYGGYPRGFGYSSRRYGYANAPRAYAYSSYRPRYFSSSPYIRKYNYPKTYTRRNVYSYNSASVRYPDMAANGYLDYGADDIGWQLLSQDGSGEALGVFAAQAGLYPKDGALKVGYALSAAMQNDLNKAAWAMRRAFRIDPDSLHYLNIDLGLRARIDILLADYQYQLKYAQGNRRFDVAFMIAALNYLIHENEAARIAIRESVVKMGDNSPSAINLQRLVSSQ